MKKVKFKVVNHNIFNEKMVDVDTSGLKSRGTDLKGVSAGFYGSISIDTKYSNGWITTTGDFGTNDYKDEFGFILTNK